MDKKKGLKVLIINTSDKIGGAAVASYRLLIALCHSGMDARMLVRDKITKDDRVYTLPRSWLLKAKFLFERLQIFLHLHLKKENLFAIDIATFGTDVTKLEVFKWADVVHIEWINQGMLSLSDIQKIIGSGKKVVWTMHDIWAATSICHYARGCEAFKSECRYCALLPSGGGKYDLSNSIWKRKKKLYLNGDITFIACSRWLREQAEQSALLSYNRIVDIPNPIDTNVFMPKSKKESRIALGLDEDKRYILFVSQRVTDERKGAMFFIETINRLARHYSQWKESTNVLLLGGHSDEIAERLHLKSHSLGYVSDEQKIVAVYNSADVFVLPSLEDNLPNTIMEAMSCALPCVSFEVGGIPEEIDHLQNGYVARYKDAEDLTRGIAWVLDEADYTVLSENARKKVLMSYSEKAVAEKYIDEYNRAFPK